MRIPKQLKNSDFRFIKIKNGKKHPVEKEWTTTNNYSFEDPEFIEYLEDDGNVGVVCGYGDLVVIDSDCEEVSEAVSEYLPKTYRVKTGSGNTHDYYYVPDLESKIVLKNNGNHYGEVQYTGSQVLMEGSLHPNGNTYTCSVDANIETISREDLLFALRDFIDDDIENYAAEEKKQYDNDIDISKIVDLSKLTRCGDEYYGDHPVHGSENGHNFWVNPEKGVWHCFRCDSGGGALSLVAVQGGLINCEDAVSGCLQGKMFHDVVEKAREEYNIDVETKKTFFDNPPKTREEVYQRFKKWLYLPDTERIDIVLAVAVSNQNKGLPLWIFLVGQSGDGKSEIVGSLDGMPNVEQIDQITTNTLASGSVANGKKVPDLGQRLQNKSTILTFTDLACLKSINKDKKAEIWGQFRTLYDGKINKRTGSGVEIKYDNCYVSMIACTTPDINKEFTIRNQLGTRELQYRIHDDPMLNEIKMKMALKHSNKVPVMKSELREAMQGFLQNITFDENITLPDKIRYYLFEKCEEIRVLRAAASPERNTGELMENTEPELTTRLVQQLALIYKSLKSLDSRYPIENFKKIIQNIVIGSSDPTRRKIYYFLKENGGFQNLREIHDYLKIGRKTIKTQCEILWDLGVLEKDVRTEPIGSYMAQNGEFDYEARTGRIEQVNYYRFIPEDVKK